MAEETTISTPVETADVDTSSSVEPTETETVETVDTSTEEPTSEVETAETETQEPTLYAGKYKSVEELEKGYKESQKAFNEVAELKKQIEAMNKANADREAQAQAQALKQAQAMGYDSVETQKISQYLDNAEFNEYWNYTTALGQDVAPQVQQYLQQGYQLLQQGYTKDAKALLEEAKRYYPSDFIEQIALAKSQEKSRLQGQYKAREQQLKDERTQKLAESLKGEFGEFLADLNENKAKADALQAYCNLDMIQTRDDMVTFMNQYNNIVNYAKEQAIKEYEAQKAIDATKEASQIESTPTATVNGAMPTYAEFMAMSRDDYNKAVEKYGLQAIMNAK